MNVAASLAFLSALGFAAWVLRRRAAAGPTRSELAIRELRPLGRDAGLSLVEVRGRSLLVGYGPHGVRLLADLDAAGRDRP